MSKDSEFFISIPFEANDIVSTLQPRQTFDLQRWHLSVKKRILTREDWDCLFSIFCEKHQIEFDIVTNEMIVKTPKLYTHLMDTIKKFCAKDLKVVWRKYND